MCRKFLQQPWADEHPGTLNESNHQIVLFLAQMSLEQVRELVGERKGNAPIRRRKRRRTNESSQEQPAKHPCASSAQKVTDSRVDGVNVVGLPAQCRRQHHLPPFL